MKDFKNIYGQDLAIEILTSSISKQHIAPAYLFSGPEGVGRKKTAKVFIRAILNKNQDDKTPESKISKKMGYVANVKDAKIILEKIYKNKNNTNS